MLLWIIRRNINIKLKRVTYLAPVNSPQGSLLVCDGWSGTFEPLEDMDDDAGAPKSKFNRSILLLLEFWLESDTGKLCDGFPWGGAGNVGCDDAPPGGAGILPTPPGGGGNKPPILLPFGRGLELDPSFFVCNIQESILIYWIFYQSYPVWTTVKPL